METSAQRYSFRDVVLVADTLEQAPSIERHHVRRDMEMTDTETLRALRSAITTLGLRVHHYPGPEALAKHAGYHKDDIVLSIYGGESSRNRMALVPAVCETFGLRYIGPDVYGRIVAQDKEISKRLASDFGLQTPAWRVVRNDRQLLQASRMNLPVVVKPLLEGSSIGITQRNRATSSDEVATLVRELLLNFRQPVLIEEFVAGREVSYSRIQSSRGDAWSFSEVIIEGDPHFFENRLFDAREKQFRTPGRTIRNTDNELHRIDHECIEAFLEAFGSYGYCRVDGRLAAGRFFFLELTPDAWIGPRGQFAMSFTEKGWTYPSVIGAVLASAG
jgi:D-alanine-D-alanine ligase